MELCPFDIALKNAGVQHKLFHPERLAQRQGRAESSKRPALFLQLGKVCKCKRSKSKAQRSFALEQQKAHAHAGRQKPAWSPPVKFFLTPNSFLPLFSLPSVGHIYLQRSGYPEFIYGTPWLWLFDWIYCRQRGECHVKTIWSVRIQKF